MAIQSSTAQCGKVINAGDAQRLKQAMFDHIVMCSDSRCEEHYRAWMRQGIPNPRQSK